MEKFYTKPLSSKSVIGKIYLEKAPKTIVREAYEYF